MRFQYQRAVLIFGICTLATAIYASHLYIFHLWRHDPISWLQAAGDAASDWYAWACLIPLFLWLARRVPLRRDRIARAIAFHIFAGIFGSLLQLLLHTLFDQLLMHGYLSAAALRSAGTAFFARTYHFGLLVYWLIVIIQNAAQHYGEKALQASQLESQLAQAQLSALKNQIHPHFLFNTLHAISSLIQNDPKAAESMIARLSELLRVSLKNENMQEVRLSEELDVLNLYLEIEKIRFGDRLQVEVSIQPETLNCFVPSLLLQPIVENSIRHGISNRRGTGLIRIHAERRNGAMIVNVQDNGGGLTSEVKEGVGLSNIRGRLNQLYGKQHSMELQNTIDGLCVRLVVPYHEHTTRYED